MTDQALGQHARQVAIAWAALVILMLASLGSSYLRLGVGNLVAGLAIALAKAAIVVWLFMRLRTAAPVVRIVAATALATLLILLALSSVDYATRPAEPAAFQAARQAPSFNGDRRSHPSGAAPTTGSPSATGGRP